jgi:preprotein translocase subunit SecB
VPTEKANPPFELKSISLFESTAIRYEGVERGSGMGVEVSIENEIGEVRDGEIECQSILSLTIKNGSDEFALFISHYRPRFTVVDNVDFSEDSPAGEALNDEVLQDVYPYHRQLIADMMSRMNIPVFFLPVLQAAVTKAELAAKD